MDRLYPEEVDVRTLSPLTLAFVGDGVYSLMVREKLASEANRPNGALHNMAVHQVRAEDATRIPPAAATITTRPPVWKPCSGFFTWPGGSTAYGCCLRPR